MCRQPAKCSIFSPQRRGKRGHRSCCALTAEQRVYLKHNDNVIALTSFLRYSHRTPYMRDPSAFIGDILALRKVSVLVIICVKPRRPGTCV